MWISLFVQKGRSFEKELLVFGGNAIFYIHINIVSLLALFNLIEISEMYVITAFNRRIVYRYSIIVLKYAGTLSVIYRETRLTKLLVSLFFVLTYIILHMHY